MPGLKGLTRTPGVNSRIRRNAARLAAQMQQLVTGALAVSDEGLFVLTLATNSGLEQTVGLSIDLQTTPGLVKDATGIKALVQDVLAIDASGIKLSIGEGVENDGSNNLRAKVKTDAGITRDSDGLSVNRTTVDGWYADIAHTHSTVYCAWRGTAAADPDTPVAGDIYYNTTDSKTYLYKGDAWIALT